MSRRARVVGEGDKLTPCAPLRLIMLWRVEAPRCKKKGPGARARPRNALLTGGGVSQQGEKLILLIVESGPLG
jgi:hypothetical protein